MLLAESRSWVATQPRQCIGQSQFSRWRKLTISFNVQKQFLKFKLESKVTITNESNLQAASFRNNEHSSIPIAWVGNPGENRESRFLSVAPAPDTAESLISISPIRNERARKLNISFPFEKGFLCLGINYHILRWLGWPSSPPKRIVFRFHETILRRWARIPRHEEIPSWELR